MSTKRLSIRVKGTKVQGFRRIELTFSRSKIRRVTNRKPGNPLFRDLRKGNLGAYVSRLTRMLCKQSGVSSILTVSTKSCSKVDGRNHLMISRYYR